MRPGTSKERVVSMARGLGRCSHGLCLKPWVALMYACRAWVGLCCRAGVALCLLELADQFMLDHLKQICECYLKVRPETLLHAGTLVFGCWACGSWLNRFLVLACVCLGRTVCGRRRWSSWLIWPSGQMPGSYRPCVSTSSGTGASGRSQAADDASRVTARGAKSSSVCIGRQQAIVRPRAV
jgi:hypothetical protein